MKMKKSISGSGLLYASAFFIPFVLIVILYAVEGLSPFGSNTLLVSDSFGQYDSFWMYYRELLSGGQDAFYSLEKTLGGSLAGIYAYYLASPFNLIFCLFPAEKLPLALHLIILLKLSLCSMSFAVFWDRTRSRSWTTLLLSTAYALCAYCVGFSWCIMWLDGVMLLPLIALGLHYLTDRGKPWIYILSLGAAIICSYYIGFMLCIFSVLYYIYLLMMKGSLKSVDWRGVGRFIISSALAGAVSAVVLLPGLLSMTGGKRESMWSILTEYISRYAYPLLYRLFPEKSSEYESMVNWLLMAGVAAVALLMAALAALFISKKVPVRLKIAVGAVCAVGFVVYDLIRENYVLLKLITATTTKNEVTSGAPNIFTGILVLLLALVYFCSSAIERREKLISLAFAAVLLISFGSLSINMIWHGFTENHSFNYRYSFIFSFFLLILAGETLGKLKNIRLGELAAPACFVALLSIAGMLLEADFVKVGVAAADVVLAAVMCAALYLMKGNNGKRLAAAGAAALVLIHAGNITFSAASTMDSLISAYQHTTEEFALSAELLDDVGDTLACDGELWRSRKDYLIKGQNDTIQGGYVGVGSFSSAEKTAVVDFMSNLGCQVYENIWANGEYGLTRAADSLLGVRWLLSAVGGYLDYQPVSGSDVYENPYVLPVGFVADAAVLNAVSDTDCPFEYTNRVYKSLTADCNDDVFVPAQVSAVTLDNLYCVLSGSDCDSVYGVQDTNGVGMLTFTIDITSEDALYFYMTAEEYQNTDIYINGTYYCKYFEPYAWNTVLLGQFAPGEQLTVSVSANSGVMSLGGAYFYYESSSALKRYHDAVIGQPCVTERIADSHLASTVTADQDGYVMYTVPYDAGWCVYVDGEKAQPQEALGVFMAVLVSAGEHTVEMKYRPQGLAAGAVISAAAVAAVAAWLILDRKARKTCASVSVDSGSRL